MIKRRITCILLFLLVMCGCSAGSSDSASGKLPEELELTVDNTVIGTVYGQNIFYTSFYPYLLVTDNINAKMIREELALNYMLEQELARLGIEYTEEEFEEYAADLYYKECLFEPERIDEIEAVRSVIGFFKDAMDMALFEGYRQGFYLNCLGDHYAEEYRMMNPQGDIGNEEYENTVVEKANAELSRFVSGVSGKYKIGSGQILMTVGEKEIRLNEAQNCYIVYTLARERIRTVDGILKGCGMAFEMQRDGFTEASPLDAQIEQSIEQMRSDPVFYNTYKEEFEKDKVGYDQFLLSMRFVLQMQYSAPALYDAYLSKTYETLTENKPDTKEDYVQQRLNELYGNCVPGNVLY